MNLESNIREGDELSNLSINGIHALAPGHQPTLTPAGKRNSTKSTNGLDSGHRNNNNKQTTTTNKGKKKTI